MDTQPEINPALQAELDDLNAQIAEAESEIALHEEILVHYQSEMTESLGYPPSMNLLKYTKEDVAWIEKLRTNCSSAEEVYTQEPSAGAVTDLSRPLISASFHEALKIGELQDRIRELRKQLEELQGTPAPPAE
jgi:uncharacterized coiled-coil protein SlyX